MSNETKNKSMLLTIATLLLGFVGGVVFTFFGKVEPYRERDAQFLEDIEELNHATENVERTRDAAANQKNQSQPSQYGNGSKAARHTYTEAIEAKLIEPAWFSQPK